MQYIFLNESGQLLDGQGNDLPSNLSEGEGHKPTVVWVTGDSVTLLEVKIPTRNASTLEQSLPYSLEEQLLCDTSEMHFAWFPSVKGQPLPIAAVTKDSMVKWKKSLKNSNLRPTKLVPDIFLAPWQPHKWTLLILENRAILRTSEFQGISGSCQWIAEYLKSHKKEKADLEVILLPSVKLPAIWTRYKPVSDEAADALLEAQYNKRRIINLLQGNYSSGFGALRKLQSLYLPVAAALVVVVLLLSIKVMTYLDLKQEKQQLDTVIFSETKSIVSSFSQGSPLHSVVNHRLQQHQKKRAKKNASSWRVLEKATPFLSSCSNCVYERIDLEDKGFSFDVGSFNTLAPLEKIVKGLQTYNVKTQLNSDTRNGNTYYRLTVNIEAKG